MPSTTLATAFGPPVAPRTDPSGGFPPRQALLTPHDFAAQFQAHRPSLLTLAAAILGRRGDAEDAVQEAGAVALAKLDGFAPGTHFGAWMGQIVRFVALNHARRRAGRASPGGSDVVWSDLEETWTCAPQPAQVDDPRALIELSREQEHFDDAVVAALEELAPIARACLLLRTVHELEYRELGRVLGIPEGTAMSHVHRARGALRTALERRRAKENEK